MFGFSFFGIVFRTGILFQSRNAVPSVARRRGQPDFSSSSSMVLTDLNSVCARRSSSWRLTSAGDSPSKWPSSTSSAASCVNDTKKVSNPQNGSKQPKDHPAKTSGPTNFNPLQASCCLLFKSGTSRRKANPCTSLTKSFITSLNIERFNSPNWRCSERRQNTRYACVTVKHAPSLRSSIVSHNTRINLSCNSGPLIR